ncbi:MAG: hypothetical protein KGD74_09955 [Candidatus Lokiarchaeota archaeon]|nr:hypothetical protein [Candidatus Lokiarchaeota archaeon]
MYIQTESYSEPEISTGSTEMLGVEVIQVAKSGKRLDIIFHRGIALSLTQKIMKIYLEKIFNAKQGNLIISIDDFGVYIHFYSLDLDNILIIIYVDKKNSIIDKCTKMYILYKKVYEHIQQRSSITEILNMCKTAIKIK